MYQNQLYIFGVLVYNNVCRAWWLAHKPYTTCSSNLFLPPSDSVWGGSFCRWTMKRETLKQAAKLEEEYQDAYESMDELATEEAAHRITRLDMVLDQWADDLCNLKAGPKPPTSVAITQEFLNQWRQGVYVEEMWERLAAQREEVRQSVELGEDEIVDAKAHENGDDLDQAIADALTDKQNVYVKNWAHEVATEIVGNDGDEENELSAAIEFY